MKYRKNWEEYLKNFQKLVECELSEAYFNKNDNLVILDAFIKMRMKLENSKFILDTLKKQKEFIKFYDENDKILDKLFCCSRCSYGQNPMCTGELCVECMGTTNYYIVSNDEYSILRYGDLGTLSCNIKFDKKVRECEYKIEIQEHKTNNLYKLVYFYDDGETKFIRIIGEGKYPVATTVPNEKVKEFHKIIFKECNQYFDF